MKSRWLGFALIGIFLQGLVLFLAKVFSFGAPPLVILLFQYIGSLVSVVIYAVIRKLDFKVSRDKLSFLVLSGFLVSTGMSFYYSAIGLASVGPVSIIHNVGLTLLPSILAFIFLKEKINLRVVLGIACAIVCIILLI